MHHIDTGQGNAAVIVAPNGDIAMIDFGRWNNGDAVLSYVQSANVTSIDYAFATHYDADHIGCLDDLASAGVMIGECIDHGGAGDTLTYNDYAATCAGKRRTAFKGETFALGLASIKVIDLNGAGVSTSDESALSLDLKLTYGNFTHEFGGDLPGESPDIESIVGPEVGDVDICTVHHHGSKFSSNDNWLSATTPEVCILSVGSNPYGHPTVEAIGRLHAHGVELYWTEQGSGAPRGPLDHVCGGAVTVAVIGGGDY